MALQWDLSNQNRDTTPGVYTSLLWAPGDTDDTSIIRTISGVAKVQTNSEMRTPLLSRCPK